MADVELVIPRMLAELVGTDTRFAVNVASIGDALESLCAVHPELRVHLFAEDGSMRPHVSCFYNDAAVESLDTPVHTGDRIVVLQAVSGG